jgi:hypothetical protein
MLVHSRLRLHLEHYHNFLNKVVEMTWMQKFIGFSMHVVYHSMFFAHHISMKWSKPSMVPLKVIGVEQLRRGGGGVNQLLQSLNNYAHFKFITKLSMMITIMQGSKQ